MRPTVKIMVRSGALLLVALSIAVAAGADAPGTYDPRSAFSQSDTDHSGAIDRRELYDRSVEVFYHADDNKDGVLVVEEFRDLPRGDDLKPGDSDRDGRLTVNEYVRIRDLEFESADGDKDGELTVDEVVEAWKGGGK
jgi:Ca2+-binding EF-hand superfamily protein